MNKDKFSRFLEKFFFIHPVAIVLIFILSSFETVKFNQEISGKEILLSILLSFLLLLVFPLFKRLLKDRNKAAILTSVFLFICLFYKDIVGSFFSIKPVQIIIKTIFAGQGSMVFLATLAVLFFFITFYLKKGHADVLKLSWFLNVLTIVFLITNIVKLSSSKNIHVGLKENEKIVNNNSSLNAPNIYYIILDSYTSDISLKKYWDYDNSKFSDYLKHRGFYTATSSSNYNLTPFSISSALNMSYLDFNNTGRLSNEYYSSVVKLINSNNVTDFLKHNNYHIFNYSFFDVSNEPKLYKDYFFFNDGFFAHTIFRFIYSKLGDLFDFRQIKNLRSNNYTVINNVKAFVKSGVESNSFIYAHLALPHFPYLFNKDGKPMPLRYADDPENSSKYLEQLKFTNVLITDCIETILKNSKSAPIIIIQGDHGFRFLKNKDQLHESFTILNAYYFPDKNYNTLYPTISPVNSFRIVFNKYFGTNLKILQDSSINVMAKEVFSRVR